MKSLKSKKRKSLKGMTLYEVIISLAIVAAMTLILVNTSALIDRLTASSNHVNRRVAEQAPKAETKYVPGAYEVDDELEITVNNDITLKGKVYQVVDPTAPDDENEIGGNMKMKFIDEIQVPTTGPATP